MSHRKASKRRRETGGDDDFSHSVAPQKKRSKSHNNESPQNTFQDESESAVRRSSRTPKPKVFDDEETFVVGRTPETSGLIQEVESPLPQTNLLRISTRDEAWISRKQRKSVASGYDEGHKRETRRSYQDYLKELVKETDVVEQTSDESYGVEQTTSKSGKSSRYKNIAKINSVRVKSEVIAGDATPKGTSVMHRTPKEKGSSYVRVKREPPDEVSPKVRSSSRTPVPKRVFSLLEGEGRDEVIIKSEIPSSPEVESDPVEFSSAKLRSSSRVHIPKKSFPLLEEDDAMKPQQTTPEQTSEARTPRGKRQHSATEEDSQRHLSKITLTNFEELRQRVRVSSRGHMPKRTFVLIEGGETPSEVQDESNVTDKVGEDEKYPPGTSDEQQKGKVAKEAMRRTSGSSKQLSRQRSSKEEVKQAANFDNKVPDDFPLSVKVERLETPRHHNKSGASESDDAKTPSSSRMTLGRKCPTGTEVDDCQGRPNKRKGKPIKRKVASSEETHISVLSVADVKVKVEPEEPKTASHYESTPTQKTTKSKSSSRKKQVIESSRKQGPSGSKHAMTIKQESMGKQDSFSLSDLAKGVGDSLEEVTDVNNGTSKRSAKEKLRKYIEQKTADSKGKALKKSEKDSEHSITASTEQEHIILKLHLPQSDESKGKKHHHHHHHHHKHKHSSGHYEDSSPKRSQHKLYKNGTGADGNQSTETKKKKISIKFKGLSSENIDRERAADSPRLVHSVQGDDEVSVEVNSTQQSKGKNGEKSAKHSKESVKKKKKSKSAADLSSSQSDGEHVKLVIRKDKLPSSSKSDEKKSSQPTTSQAKAGDQKKMSAPSASSKQGKGGTTPKKTSKSPSVGLKCNSFRTKCALSLKEGKFQTS